MSNTEIHIGTAKEIAETKGMSFSDKIAQLELMGHKIKASDEGDNYIDCDTLETVGDRVFKIDNTEIDEFADICDAKQGEDGNISYQLKFYNGGTCFHEMFEDAIEEMES